MGKDWTGNGKSIFTTLGASNHTEKEREINDYYATDPIAVPENFTIRSKERSQTGLACILAITAPRKPRNRIYPIGNIKHAVQSMGAVQRYLRRGWKCSKKA